MQIPVYEELKMAIKGSGLTVPYLAHRSGVCPATLRKWLRGITFLPRVDTMLRVAAVLGQHIELTPTVRKMVNYYPKPKINPPPPVPFVGKRMSRHAMRMALMRLQ